MLNALKSPEQLTCAWALQLKDKYEIKADIPGVSKDALQARSRPMTHAT